MEKYYSVVYLLQSGYEDRDIVFYSIDESDCVDFLDEYDLFGDDRFAIERRPASKIDDDLILPIELFVEL